MFPKLPLPRTGSDDAVNPTSASASNGLDAAPAGHDPEQLACALGMDLEEYLDLLSA